MSDPKPFKAQSFEPLEDDPLDHENFNFNELLDPRNEDELAQSEIVYTDTTVKPGFTPANAQQQTLQQIAAAANQLTENPDGNQATATGQSNEDNDVVMVNDGTEKENADDDSDENDNNDDSDDVSSVASDDVDLPTDMEDNSFEAAGYIAAQKKVLKEKKRARSKRIGELYRKFVKEASDTGKAITKEELLAKVFDALANEDAEEQRNNPATPRKKKGNKVMESNTPGGSDKKETAIPAQTEAIARLKEAFKDNGDRELLRETLAWVRGFYTHREGMSTKQKRSSLTSDAYFRREVTTPMDAVLAKYKKGEPWSGDLPSRAVLIGSTFLHQPGQSNAKVMGTLLLIQKLDLISIPEMRYTYQSDKQSQAITKIESRLTELSAKVNGQAAKILDNNKLAKDTARTVKDAMEVVTHDMDAMTESLQKKATKARAQDSRIVALEARLNDLGKKVDLLERKADNLNALDKFKRGAFNDLTNKVDALSAKLLGNQVENPAPVNMGVQAAKAALAARPAKQPRHAETTGSPEPATKRRRRDFGDDE